MFARAEAVRGAVLAASAVGLLALPGVARGEEPSGRGLIGGAISTVTSTLDGAIAPVTEVTGGAASLPTTEELTSTVTGTLEVVTGTVTETVAPVTDGVAQATLTIPGLADVGGAAVLGLVVGNAGDVACTPLLAVTIKNGDGATVSAGETVLSSIAAGTTAQFALPWPSGLGSGTYDVEATASACGLPQTVELSVRLAATAATDAGSGGSTGGNESGGSGGGSGSGGGGSGGGSTAGGGASSGGSGSGSGSGSGGATAGAGSGGSGAVSDANDAGGAGPGRVDQASTATGAPAAAGDGAAPANAGRGQAQRGGRDRDGASVGAGAGALVGPPAPARLVAATGADRIAGAQGSAAQPTRASRGALPTTFGGAVRAIPAVLERAAPALLVLGLIGAMFLLQEALARRDPKLALAPVHGDDDLDFAEPGTFLRRISAVVPPGRRGGEPPAVT